VPAAVAWLALGSLWVRELPLSLCLAPQMDGMSGLAAHVRAGFAMAEPMRLAGEWALMLAAMMLPLTAPMVGHVWARSFPARRTRAVGLFLGGYLLVWAIATAAATPVLIVARGAVGALGAAPVLGLIGAMLAAWWQLTASKRLALNRCHGTVPLRAFGSAADRDAASFGLLHGARCVRVCLPVMVLPMLGGAGLSAMAVIFVLLLGERSQHTPQLDRSALILVLLGLLSLA
jgi:predicted metal-binding membrane protein